MDLMRVSLSFGGVVGPDDTPGTTGTTGTTGASDASGAGTEAEPGIESGADVEPRTDAGEVGAAAARGGGGIVGSESGAHSHAHAFIGPTPKRTLNRLTNVLMTTPLKMQILTQWSWLRSPAVRWSGGRVVG